MIFLLINEFKTYMTTNLRSEMALHIPANDEKVYLFNFVCLKLVTN